MKRELTFDNYIAMCDRYAESQFQCGAWWPSINDVKTKLEPKLDQHLEFLIWIAETAEEPKTIEEEQSQAYINRLLNETLIFTDNNITPTVEMESETNESEENAETNENEEEVEIIFTEGE